MSEAGPSPLIVSQAASRRLRLLRVPEEARVQSDESISATCSLEVDLLTGEEWERLVHDAGDEACDSTSSRPEPRDPTYAVGLTLPTLMQLQVCLSV